MYKPQTIEQFKVYRFLSRHFVMEQVLLSPLSRFGLILEDKDGERAAFVWQDGTVKEVDIPVLSPPEEIRAYIKEFRALEPTPILNDFVSITRWWLEHPNPLTHQQALGLSDSLYRHFLKYPLIDEETAVRFVLKGLVTEKEYLDIQLWYFNGNALSCWLGPLGIDGTGYLYGLTLRYRKPDERKFVFYLKDDYYCCMNHVSV